MYYFVCYINILLTRRGRLNSRLKKRTRCLSVMALNRASEVSAADWISQIHVKSYRNLSRVVILFFSVVEIPIKHSSLYNKNIILSQKPSLVCSIESLIATWRCRIQNSPSDRKVPIQVRKTLVLSKFP